MKQHLKINQRLSRPIIGFSILVLSAFSMTGCEKDYIYRPKVDITTPVSYSADIQPIWNSNCMGSGCHNTGAMDPDLTSANSYSALMTGGYVDTTNAAASTLYMRMTDSNDPMPPTGILSATPTNKVLAWIEQGAKNN